MFRFVVFFFSWQDMLFFICVCVAFFPLPFIVFFSTLPLCWCIFSSFFYCPASLFVLVVVVAFLAIKKINTETNETFFLFGKYIGVVACLAGRSMYFIVRGKAKLKQK